MSRASQGASARSVSTQSARHVVSAQAPQAPERAAQRYNSGLTALRATELLISCREAMWSQCSASCVVCTVVVWCEDRCSATVLVLRLLGDCWPCATFLLGFLPGSMRTARLDSIPGEVFACLVWSMSHQGPMSCVSAQFGLPVSVAVLQPGADYVSCSSASGVYGGSSPARRTPLTMSCQGTPLEAAYHHSIGAFLAMNMCRSSKAAVSQSCHFALFVNPVARSSTDEFFTLCDVHLEHERTSQAACLQRRYE